MITAESMLSQRPVLRFNVTSFFSLTNDWFLFYEEIVNYVLDNYHQTFEHFYVIVTSLNLH